MDKVRPRHETGWQCPACHKIRQEDYGPDPCIGYLPGVDYACCGHGGHDYGYISFTNGTVIRFGFIHQVEEWANGRMKRTTEI